MSVQHVHVSTTSYMSVHQVTSMYNKLHVMMPVQHVVTCLIRNLMILQHVFTFV